MRILFLGLSCVLILAANADAQTRSRQIQLRFAKRSPLSSLAEQQKRIAWEKTPFAVGEAKYSLKKESFSVYLPRGHKKGVAYGLLVWISPYTGRVPPRWEKKLDKHKLIAICPRANNDRHPAARAGLVLDAVFNMNKRYTIDPERSYVGGFSDGGRLSSFLILHYPEIFRGAIYDAGCDYYKNVPITKTQILGGSIPPPTAERLKLAKERSRHVYVVGSQDPDLLQLKHVRRRARKDGFRYTRYIQIPKLDHKVFSSKWFEKCVRFLDHPEAAKKPASRPSENRNQGTKQPPARKG